MPLASAVCSDTELPPKGRGRCFSKTGLTTELDFGAGKTVDRRVLFLSGAALASGLLTWYPGSDARTDPVLLSSLRDRKSTRLNSSHVRISYAVFCLKKKNTTASPAA